MLYQGTQLLVDTFCLVMYARIKVRVGGWVGGWVRGEGRKVGLRLQYWVSVLCVCCDECKLTSHRI